MSEQFHYVIARPWEEGKPELCIYTYGSQIHHGDMEDALWNKEHADFMSREEGHKYDIYLVTFNKLDDER
jgi:hypothetical protein